MKKNILLLALGILLINPIQSFAMVFFFEDFESGSSPFDFDMYIGDSICNPVSFPNIGGDRGVVWQTIFKSNGGSAEEDCTDSYMGFVKRLSSASGNTYYIKFYVRYGDSDHPYTWDTAIRSHELKIPDLYASDNRIIGKHIGGANPSFWVYTPQGPGEDVQNHIVSGFVSNVWYCMEFMIQDNGSSRDVVKIWVNNNDENNPDYSYTSSGNLFSSSGWTTTTPWQFAYRNHAVVSDQYFYMDDITISDSFNGTGSSGPPPPPANTGLPWTSDFEENDFHEWNGYIGGSPSVVNTNPFAGSYCARSPLTEGTHSDNYVEHKFGDYHSIGKDKVEEVYLSLYSKLDPGYVWPSNTQKIAILNLTDGQVSQRRYQVMIVVSSVGEYFVEYSYIDSWQFFALTQNQGTATAVRFGEWDKLKLYTKLNTPGNSDGVVKLWVNDELKISYDNVNIRQNTSYGMNKLIMSSYATDASGSNGFQYYDDWILSTTALEPPGNVHVVN